MVEKFASVESVSKELVDGYIKACSEGIGWNMVEENDQRCSRTFHLLFESIASFLSKVKSTEHKVALVLEDYNQNFQFAAFVEYIPNPNEDMPGSWTLGFTFDPNEITDAAVTYRLSGNEFKDVASAIAIQNYGYVFLTADGEESNISENSRSTIMKILGAAARAIKGWVDENSISPEPITTSIDGKGILEAMVDENGNKIGSFTPSGELKNIIKDDAAVEDKAEQEKSAKKKKK